MHRRIYINHRILCAVLISALMLTLTACHSTANPQSLSAKASADEGIKTYITSVYPLYVAMLNLTAQIEGVEVVNLTGTAVGCLHDYQLSPGNLKTLEKADAFIYNGADLEAYIDQILATDTTLPLINASENLTTLNGNPHLWVSLNLMMKQIDNIARGLVQVDPDHAAQYQMNAKTYLGKIKTLQTTLHAQIDPLPNRDIVTFHEAFPYFAQEFNLNIAAVVEREPDSKPSAGELAATIDQIRSLKIQAIFVEPQYDTGVAQTIAHETAIKVFTLDPASSGPLNEPDAYLNIMRQNGEILVEALS